MDKTIALSNKICYHCEQTDLFTFLVAVVLAVLLILIHRAVRNSRRKRIRTPER